MDEDFLLVQRMRLGDERALGIFVEKYYSLILNYCHAHVADYGYAEDMAQETFARFFQTLPDYHHYGKAANYLYVIAANACRDFRRKNREIPVEELPEAADTDGDGLTMRLDIQMALRSLSEEIREVAVLYFMQELKQKDIARILNIGLPLVKYRVARARRELSVYLGKERV
jgi:RNA polymerase sigma-70 factor (ECF subfamily)